MINLLKRLATSLGLGLLLVTASVSAQAFEVGIIGFQFTSETHARVANAAAAAARAKGWRVTLLNSEGSLPRHAEQLDSLIAKKVDALHRRHGQAGRGRCPVQGGA